MNGKRARLLKGSASWQNLGVFLLSAILVAAVGWNLLSIQSADSTAATTQKTSITPLEQRIPAPDFEVRTTDGPTYRLSDHTGDVRLLYFTGVG